MVDPLVEVRKLIPEFLPSGTRAVSVTKNPLDYWYGYDYPCINFLVEVPPTLQDIHLGSNKFGGSLARYNIEDKTAKVALPWQYFVFSQIYAPVFGGGGYKASSMQLFLWWSKTRILSLDDDLIPGRVPDIEEKKKGWICLGQLENVRRDSSTVSQAINEIIKLFYAYSQGSHLHGGYHLPSQFTSIEAWAQASIEDPYNFLHWPDWEKLKIAAPLRNFFPKEPLVGAVDAKA